jgi:hypothetical protein
MQKSFPLWKGFLLRLRITQFLSGGIYSNYENPSCYKPCFASTKIIPDRFTSHEIAATMDKIEKKNSRLAMPKAGM